MGMQHPDERAIEKHTRELLKRAETKGKFPTRVDDIIAAAGLVEPRESMLSNLVIADAPFHLKRRMLRLSGRVRAVLDRKAREIHIDPGISNRGRLAFHKLHEVTHDILPWQRALGYADDDATLAPSVKQLFEREASIGASNLLFQHEYFDDLSHQYSTGQASILELAQMVGASGHATFRRFVNVRNGVIAGIVMDLSPCSRDPITYNHHEVVTSKKWDEQFGAAFLPTKLRSQPYSFLNSAEQARTSGEAVRTDFALPDLRNEMTELNAELYSNGYCLFVLVWKDHREILRRRRIIVPTAKSV